jgi:hypothetical protein
MPAPASLPGWPVRLIAGLSGLAAGGLPALLVLAFLLGAVATLALPPLHALPAVLAFAGLLHLLRPITRFTIRHILRSLQGNPKTVLNHIRLHGQANAPAIHPGSAQKYQYHETGKGKVTPIQSPLQKRAIIPLNKPLKALVKNYSQMIQCGSG